MNGSDRSAQRKSGGIDGLQPHTDPMYSSGQQSTKMSPSGPIGASSVEKSRSPGSDPFRLQAETPPSHISNLFGKNNFHFDFPNQNQSAPSTTHFAHPDSAHMFSSSDPAPSWSHLRSREPDLDLDNGNGRRHDSFDGIIGDMDFDLMSISTTDTSQSPPVRDHLPEPPGEHPLGEYPSRTLFVRNINSNVEDEELRCLFEQYGPIRTMYTQCKHRGFVMISYYDIRHAKNAMRHLQTKVLRRRKLDIHYSIPKENPSEKDQNQGTLVVFNLDPATTNEELKEIFGMHGEIKEVRETPNKKHHKFIEFYDVRDADKAMKLLNKSDIRGKKIKIEASRPGGPKRSAGPSEIYNSDDEMTDPQHSFSMHHSVSLGATPFSKVPFSPDDTNSYPPVHSTLSKYPRILSPSPQGPQAVNSGPYVRGIKPRSPGPIQPPLMGSPEHSNMPFPPGSTSPQNMWSPPHNSRGFGDGSQPGSPKSLGTSPILYSFPEGSPPYQKDRSPEDTRSRRAGSEEDKSKFKLVISEVGKDNRTTLMIKNIPNKYNQKMLLQAVDEYHKGAFDFFYLPIDFKNKCNVGYAFINFITTEHIRAFYERFNGKKWEKFNSEKVCIIAYARIQGKNSLIQHFQNSSLMCEDKKCRPIIFHSDGPSMGEVENFPVGPNVRARKNSSAGV